ncbi:MAG TPA: amino acid adenylation domain-containing protein [Longimicrobiaceae bacterium]|nr:amino acid adenylation domain-containing protein [Longimicrobiaceae bacterium]
MSYSNVLHAFGRSVSEHGPKTAIECADREVTYAELDARSAHLARRLATRVPPGAPVAVLSDDTIEVVTAILGILKAGCAFMPLTPRAPQSRLEAMLAVGSPGCLVAGEGLLDRAASLVPGEERIVALADGEDPHGRGEGAPREPAGPDEMCYVYFTSGSTGQPKAIAGRHRGLDHFVQWEVRTLGLGPGARVSQLTTPVHDPFLRDVFVPLCSGGTICAPGDRETLLDARRLIEWIDDARVHVLHSVPSLFRSILNAELDPDRFPSLRYVLLAGEALLPADVRRWMEVFGERVQLVNVYGPTETTLAKFAYFVQPPDRERRTIPIGKPIEGAAAVVLDARGNPCPVGTIGEIYIRTPFRSLGYLGDPERTREAFVPNPLSGNPDDIVYRTGDYGRVLDDGNFELLGRRDHQVKIRGLRVELTEIENVLRGHPQVRDVAVVDREHADGTRFLCAYVVSDGAPQSEALRAFVAESLPEEYLPTAFVVLEALPRTITGKLDRRALPAPGGADAMRTRPFVEPRNRVEEALAAIWRELLGAARIGVHDNFFELGGHSLLATRILVRVRDVLGAELSLQALFEAPSVAGLAERVESRLRAGAGGDAPPVVPVPRDRPLPLSFAQERLWFIDQLEPASAAYNLPAALRLRGALDVPALERSLTEVVRRHEVLRTTFPLTGDGRAMQVVAPPEPAMLHRLDLSGQPEGDREREARRLAAREAATPFDLASGPLLRATLVRMAEEEHVLLFTLHHIVSDGWSMGVLTREVSALYPSFQEGRTPPLRELPVQYADYAVWQREWLRGEALERQVAYWKGSLAGAPLLLELPTDHARTAMRNARGGTRRIALPDGTVRALRSLAQGEGATLFMALLAAFQALLSRYSGQEDVVVGTPIAGRTRLELEGLIGLFVNTLALRADLSGDPTFRALLRRVREVTLGAYAHQELPFERLVEELQPPRDVTHTPVFQVMLALQSAERAHLRLGEVAVEGIEAGAAAARFDLMLDLAEDGERVHGVVVYRADLWEEETIERLMGHFLRLLEEVSRDPDRPLSGVELLGSEERARILSGEAMVSRVPAHRPDACLHHLFEEQAARTPDRVAVRCGERTLTYAALDGEAGRFAHHLRGRGVLPGERVGVCVERSAEMMVALLGVLKAGAAYVPLDPSYPPERLSLVLEDAGIGVLVTQESLRTRLPGHAAGVVSLDADAEEIARSPATPVSGAAADPRGPAYVIYTSGSTGRPKGVVVPHRAVVNFVCSIRERPGVSAGDVLAAVTTLSFDISVLELFVPLTAGGEVAVMPREVVTDGALLAEELERCGATILQGTPALWRLLLEGGWEGKPGLTMLCGGEALPWELAARLLERGGSLWNMYGPTETTIWSAVHRVGPTDGAAVIGGPVDGTQLYVLDAGLRPVPQGVPGELYIGGDGVADGYLGRPELTAERFVPDPFGDRPGARLYRTGDVVRGSGAGMRFLGRTDQQMKVRGHRIEPGEIEAVLVRHPAVAQAVVVARADASGEKRLAAYVVAEPGAAPVAEALQAHAREHLPAYMVPSLFVVLDAFPLTPNGKVDRKALPDPASAPRVVSERYVAPATATETAVVEVWEALLGVSPVGVLDDFFLLGGHSMLAVRMMAQLRRRFGVELPLAILFERPTVRDLARVIGEDAQPGRWSPLVPIQPQGTRTPLFFVHPVGGQVLCYADLARSLGTDQPFYALQASGLAEVGDREVSIEEMAAEYVSAIREVQPHGPYVLGGWSFGGFVAFAMAQQLREAGEEVALLVLLDSESPEAARSSYQKDEAEVLAQLALEHGHVYGETVAIDPEKLRPLDTEGRVRLVLEALRAKGLVAPEIDVSWVMRLLSGYQARKRAAARYKPASYPGRLVLFQPSEPESEDEVPFGPEAPSAGWRLHCTEPVEFHVVGGRHATMVRGENAAMLAKRLHGVIDECVYSPCA